MIQDLDETLMKLSETQGISGGEHFIPKLCDVVFSYSELVAEELKKDKWDIQYKAGLHAGYILCLLGRVQDGIQMLDQAVALHKENYGQYDWSESRVLEFALETIKEFCSDPIPRSRYEQRLLAAQSEEYEGPEDLRRQIAHKEADMECTEHDMDVAYSNGRTAQGELFQRLGEHETAITYFEQSMKEDPRDWRFEVTLKNTLLIVDSLTALERYDEALDRFMELMRKLMPNEIEIGKRIPDEFVSNYNKLSPYFHKLGLNDSLKVIAEHITQRLKNLSPEEHWERSEVSSLTRILGDYHVKRQEYQKASDAYDAGREQLEYKHHLSRRNQAEFAILAGNLEKAKSLIAEEDAEERGSVFDRQEKIFDLVALELQLDQHEDAIDRLTSFCKEYRQRVSSSSFSSLFNIHQVQIAIMKALIGPDYAEQLREYARAKHQEMIPSNVKMLPTDRIKGNKEKQRKESGSAWDEI